MKKRMVSVGLGCIAVASTGIWLLKRNNGVAPVPALDRPVVVGGKYWSAYFVGKSLDPSIGNFMLFGIFPAEFKNDGSFKSEDFDTTWRILPGNKVELKFEGGEMIYQAEDGGDVLVPEKGIHYGLKDNHMRFLRDNPARRKQIVGRYEFVSGGTQTKSFPRSLTFNESQVVGGEFNNKWLASGDYVILLGKYDRQYMHPSIVFRVKEEGRVLHFKPSDKAEPRDPEFSPADWEMMYRKVGSR